jgi:rubrerythrin
MTLQQAFEMLNPTVKVPAGLFFNVADTLKGGKAYYYVCSVCGNTIENACLKNVQSVDHKSQNSSKYMV